MKLPRTTLQSISNASLRLLGNNYDVLFQIFTFYWHSVDFSCHGIKRTSTYVVGCFICNKVFTTMQQVPQVTAHNLTLMLLGINLTNAKRCKKNLKNDRNPGKLGLIWEYSARAFQWVPTRQGLDGFHKSLRHCTLDKSSLSIGRVKCDIMLSCKLALYDTNTKLNCWISDHYLKYMLPVLNIIFIWT